MAWSLDLVLGTAWDRGLKHAWNMGMEPKHAWSLDVGQGAWVDRGLEPGVWNVAWSPDLELHGGKGLDLELHGDW